MDEVQSDLSSMSLSRDRALQEADAMVLRYLAEQHSSSSAAAALRDEWISQGIVSLDNIIGRGSSLLDLFKSIQGQTRGIPNAGLSDESQIALPTLPGPSRLSFHLTQTLSTLHDSNILLLRPVYLPTRRFNTAPADGSDPHFETTLLPCLLSSGADKRVLFFDLDTQEVIDSLEPVTRTVEAGHTAPVLDAAQHPVEKRELITAGMDGKVILWDLLKREPALVLTDHKRFVVCCQWDREGRYLATAGYDKEIRIYERIPGPGDARQNHGEAMAVDGDDLALEDNDEVEIQPLKTQLKFLYKLSTPQNPETLTFVKAAEGDATWLVWTQRDDCFLHYLEIASSSSGEWQELLFNTNENSSDEHVSFSLLSVSLHPTLPFLSVITGSHASSSSNSFILLMPLFSSRRLRTIHTTAPGSSTYIPRQAFFPPSSGSAVLVSTEDGHLKLYSLLPSPTNPKSSDHERADVGVHGSAAEDEETKSMSQEEKVARWRMGGMNGLVKDVIVLPDGRVVSCGFDRTVRVIQAVEASS